MISHYQRGQWRRQRQREAPETVDIVLAVVGRAHLRGREWGVGTGAGAGAGRDDGVGGEDEGREGREEERDGSRGEVSGTAGVRKSDDESGGLSGDQAGREATGPACPARVYQRSGEGRLDGMASVEGSEMA